MKLSDFTRPALRAHAVSAAALATVSFAHAHARSTSLGPAPHAKVSAASQSTIHSRAPLEPATYALTLQ